MYLLIFHDGNPMHASAIENNKGSSNDIIKQTFKSYVYDNSKQDKKISVTVNVVGDYILISFDKGDTIGGLNTPFHKSLYSREPGLITHDNFTIQVVKHLKDSEILNEYLEVIMGPGVKEYNEKNLIIKKIPDETLWVYEFNLNNMQNTKLPVTNDLDPIRNGNNYDSSKT